MGSGANNTARYLGGAAGAALVVSIASAGGAHALIAGWNIAANRFPNPFYGAGTIFQFPSSLRLGVKFTF